MACVYCQRPGGVTIWIGPAQFAHRSCFIEADKRSELAEGGWDPREVVRSFTMPAKRRGRVAANRTGESCGSAVVEGSTHHLRGDGRMLLLWVLRCACGKTFQVESGKPLRPACASCASRKHTRRVATLHAGKTASEIADMCGVTTEAIRRRLARGWTLERAMTERNHRRAA